MGQNIIVNEPLNIPYGDAGKGLDFDPFGELIDGHNDESLLAS